MKHYLVLVHSHTNFKLDNSKLHKLDNWEQISKIFKISKTLNALINFRQIHTKGPWLIYHICVRFTKITPILRQLELHRHFSKNSKSHKITNRVSIVLKIVTINGLRLLHYCIEFHIDISSRLWVIRIWKVENRTHTHTRASTHVHLDASWKSHFSMF